MVERKKLGESAKQFIKSGPAQTPPTDTTGDRTSSTTGGIDDLLVPSETRETRIRFTVDVSTDLHDRLSIAALRAKKTKSQLAREILDRYLPE